MSYRKYLMTDDVPPSELYKTVKIGTDSDTISRQAAITALSNEIVKRRLLDEMYDGCIDEFQTEEILKKLPPVQPERIKGHWIEKPHVHGVAYCSLCDYELHTNDTNFCPNCGADMREVTE